MSTEANVASFNRKRPSFTVQQMETGILVSERISRLATEVETSIQHLVQELDQSGYAIDMAVKGPTKAPFTALETSHAQVSLLGYVLRMAWSQDESNRWKILARLYNMKHAPFLVGSTSFVLD